MRFLHDVRIIHGGLIWLGLLGFGLLAFRSATSKSPGGLEQLLRFASNQNRLVNVEFVQQQPLAVGDLVFLENSPTYAPIGYVSRAGDAESTTLDVIWADQATVTLFSNAPQMESGHFLTFHLPGNDTAWVIETMFPPTKRHEITRLIMEAYASDGAEILDAIRPIIANSLSDATGIVRTDFQAAIAKREDRLQMLSQKYRVELLERQLIPLMREEIWPIIQTESELLVSRIGEEVWKEISLFRFAWRYMYDRSVGPEVSLTNRELNRFVESKVVPILESHLNEILEVQTRVVARISNSRRVKETFLAAIKNAAGDPEVQQILKEVFQEVLINNQRLRDSLRDNWNSPEALAAIEMTSSRLEPTITEIGIALFGSADQKITPEFARVLRHRILLKDSRWLTLRKAADPSQLPAPATTGSLIAFTAEPGQQIPYAPGRER
jgi:hypothetical protein